MILLSCDISDSYPEAEWTLIFYMADDRQAIPLISDVYELTEEENTSENTRLVFLYDGEIDGDSKLEILDSPFSENSREISLSETGLTTDSNGDLDMSVEATLQQYIEYVKSTFPAENYALYIGSHGTGFTSTKPAGLEVEDGDEAAGSDFLTISEIANATTDDNKMNLMVFDVCSMGNIENIYELRNSTDYIVASPELIPGAGNNYESFVEAAYNLSSTTAYSLGEETLRIYFEAYEEGQTNDNGFEERSLQQLYDTSKIADIVENYPFNSILLSDISGSGITFNSENYTDLYEYSAGDLKTDLGDAITIADGGEYKWISIYTPDSADYNDEYETTAFAALHDEWVSTINP